MDRGNLSSFGAYAPRVFVLAGFPPPPGGVAVHADRLCNLLLKNGYDVFAYETNPRRDKLVERKYRYYHSPRLVTAFRVMKDALRLGPSLVHLHVSEIGNPMPLLLGVPVLSRLAPVMITVHSGGFPARVAGSNVLFKVFLGDSIRRATHVIAVSELIGAALIEHFRVRKEIISVIPAFLRPPGNGYSPSRSEAGVFLASGYGAQVYFWEGLLEAAKTVTGIRELVLVFYTHYERPYFDVVLEKAQGKFPFKVTIRKDLSEEEFLAELARCSVFVRPTFADGDSLALREALALGKTVVASDAVPRPPSCILFRTGDSNDLRTKLTLATSQPAEKNLLVEDFSESLLTLYADVIQRFSKVSSAS